MGRSVSLSVLVLIIDWMNALQFVHAS